MDLSNLQYIQNIPIDNIIKVSDRLVSLGFLTQQEKDNVLKMHPFLIHGRLTYCFHPDREKFIPRLSVISRKLSSHMRRIDAHYPPIQRGVRRNVYLLADYERFGDDIIRAYMIENPISSWGIEWHWMDIEATNSN